MRKKNSRIVGLIMLLAAIVFIGYSLMYPERSFNLPLKVTYFLFSLYILIMIIFLVAPFKNKN